MREIARDQVEVMNTLGYDQFSVIGHDRGARCAYRMALDHPRTVTRLAVLDIVPTGDAFRRADMEFSLKFWAWCHSLQRRNRCLSNSSPRHRPSSSTTCSTRGPTYRTRSQQKSAPSTSISSALPPPSTPSASNTAPPPRSTTSTTKPTVEGGESPARSSPYEAIVSLDKYSLWNKSERWRFAVPRPRECDEIEALDAAIQARASKPL